MFTDSKVSLFRLLPTGIITAMLLFFAGCETRQGGHEKRLEERKLLRYKVTSYAQTLQILDNLGYTDEAFRRGMDAIPRVELTRISSRWADEARGIPVAEKKSLFSGCSLPAP